MDWMKVKLTADDFEQGSIASSGAVGSAYNSLKLVNSANLRTKNLVPVSKVFYIPVKPGYQYWVAQFNKSLGYLGSAKTSGWIGVANAKQLVDECSYICILIKKDSGNITLSDFNNAMESHIFTEGKADYGTTLKGDLYTKGRNFLPGTKTWAKAGLATVPNEKFGSCSIAGSTSISNGNDWNFGLFSDLPVGDQPGQTYTFSFWAKGTAELKVSFYGNTGYTGVKSTVANDGRTANSRDGYMNFNLTSDWKHYWVKWTLADQEGTSNLKHVLFRTTAQSGKSVYVAKPMLNLGDEVYPYSSAPEDESNPTEVS